MYTYTEDEKRKGEVAWQMWWARIRACQRFRQQYIFGEQKWERYYNTYKNLMWEDNADDQYDISSDNLPDRISVPITTSTILTIIPFLVNEKASYHCEPRQPSSVVNAMLKEKVLNYEYQRKEIQVQLKKVVYDSAILGHGICKTGYTLEIDEAASKQAGGIEYDNLIDDESVYARRIDPRDFWFDYCAPDKNLDTARYTIERYFKYIPDLVENTSYKKSVREKIDNGTYKPITVSSIPTQYDNVNDLSWLNDSTFDNYESNLAVLYEIWDKKYNQVITFCEGIVEPLRVMDNPYPYLKTEFPYIKMDFIYRPNEFYGFGIPEFIEAQQFELNRHRTFAFNHRRRFSARKYEVTQEVDHEELEKLPDAEDGTYIIVPSIGSVRPIDDVPLPRDYSLIEALIKQDINEMTGADALARGAQLQSRATLGEVQVRSNILSLKLNERVAEVDRLFLRTGKQLAGHIGGNYTKSMIVRLQGIQGEFWVEVNNEDLKDEVDITMDTVSAPRRNPEVEAQQRIQMFQFTMQLLPLIQAGVIPAGEINFVELLKWALEGFERVDLGRFFPSALNPLQPLQEQIISPNQIQGQQTQQGQQSISSPQDLIRSISSGNRAGLQAAGAA